MFSTDYESYQKARLIKLKKATIDESFAVLAQWIDAEFKVKTLDIALNSAGMLMILLDFEHDMEKFRNKNRFEFSKRKIDAIKNKYVELTNQKADFGIYFESFELVAREKTSIRLPIKKFEAFKKQYENQLWEIVRFYGLATFFFYTNEALNEAKTSGLTNEIKQKYYEMLKPYDEFNYLSIENFNARFDSKEDFDNIHNGNWRSWVG